jgi:hypothetical protein
VKKGIKVKRVLTLIKVLESALFPFKNNFVTFTYISSDFPHLDEDGSSSQGRGFV